LLDWPRLTSSFGCTTRPPPRAPPSSSEARLASTSLTFMLVWVPLPVCQTDSGNSSGQRPASTSSAAATIASLMRASSPTSSRLTIAAARLTRTSAWIRATGILSVDTAK
jgi:hypothetical protein